MYVSPSSLPVAAPAPLGRFLPGDGLDPLVALAAPARGSRIVVVAPGAIDLACELIRAGYSTASVVRLSDQVSAHTADVVIIPAAMDVGRLAQAIPFARRLLDPRGVGGGVIVLRLAADRSETAAAWARRQLEANGFCAVRVRTARGETLVGAELPGGDAGGHARGGRVS